MEGCILHVILIGVAVSHLPCCHHCVHSDTGAFSDTAAATSAFGAPRTISRTCGERPRRRMTLSATPSRLSRNTQGLFKQFKLLAHRNGKLVPPRCLLPCLVE